MIKMNKQLFKRIIKIIAKCNLIGMGIILMLVGFGFTSLNYFIDDVFDYSYIIYYIGLFIIYFVFFKQEEYIHRLKKQMKELKN